MLAGLPAWRVADALAPSIAIGTAFGRVGCFLNGCCYGRRTQMAWGVLFPHDSFAYLEYGDQPVHPSQIYNALAGLLLFILFQSLRRRFRVPGVMFWTFIVLFAAIRIPLDLTRSYEADAVILHLGLVDITESQFMSLGLMLFGALMIMRLRRNAPRATIPAAALP